MIRRLLIRRLPELLPKGIKTKSMSEETDRAKELLKEAYGLAQRSRTLRLQVRELAKKAARLREAKKKVRAGLARNRRIHKPSAP